MVEAARRKLRHHGLVVANEEDVALSAFDSLCRGAVRGNFAQLSDRHDLWPLLLTITAQKSIDRIRWEKRHRRGGGKNVLRDTELPETGQHRTIDEIFSTEPTPEFLVLMDEECSRLLRQLRDDTLREVVVWKLEGHTNEQIAELLGVSVHTVGRKLRMIRLAWSQELNRKQDKEPPVA
jgi:DNA-directed RNA polymerase specialized sigma24 family protein